jgi:signal transduction histidine kinase
MDEGRPISDFTHKLAYDTLEGDAQAVLKELSPIERELETRDGRSVLVRMRPYRTSDDRIDGVAITFLDVTTLKRTQKALHASEKKLLSELEVTRRLHHMTMTMATADSTATALNEIVAAAIELHASQFGSIHLLSDGDGDGDGEFSLTVQARFPEAYLERLDFLSRQNDFVFQQVLDTKEVLSVDDLNAESEALGGADELFSAILVAPLFADDGSVLGLLSVYFREPRSFASRDVQIAELMSRHAAALLVRRRHQDQLQSLIETLRQRTLALEKSEALLSEQAMELRVQDKAKEDFISMLGHELRNPLAAVLNCLDFLALDGAMGSSQSTRISDGSLRQSLEIINRQSRHMQKLIDDLLDISRVSRGKLNLRLEVVDICACVRDVADAIRPRFDTRRVDLLLDLPATPVLVTADPERAMQILDNLLRNASSYTDAGGEATVRVEIEDHFARISVRDSGIGLEPEKIASLFEPYRQLGNGSRDGGLGLGLTLVKQLAELQGGTVSANSEGRGHGSEFIVCLPLSESPDEGPEQRPVAKIKPEHGHRVLVVDDKSDNADALAAILVNLKQTVQTAYGGEEALKIAATFKPKIVFLDISMPEMSGYEVARRLRNRDQGGVPVLIALTGHPHMLEPKLFDHHLLKPIMIPTVVDLLNRVGSPE